MDEVTKLKEELTKLKLRYKNKCKKLEEANKKIKNMTHRNKNDWLWEHEKYLKDKVLRELTQHIDKYMYKVIYYYNDETYSENQVQSYGNKWLKESLCMKIAKNQKMLIYPSNITIIKAEKLW